MHMLEERAWNAHLPGSPDTKATPDAQDAQEMRVSG
jgi:hypothetical protein